ncbi:uncharacterized protein CCOS01_05629 [Colletotrichum costaricense]|uniref:Uncharacterized protein n=1 Tax=Colletotrichum costaricense TaxID=1209916 RepID=A0AAI9Z1Z8_9PEZI|nr:uncharacterized protein CCOS01_05629 [Colletotrichum costaricense]KAK1530526.1 hypothetical protein CCOS01_05629 [Colletotrichum costaricense]
MFLGLIGWPPLPFPHVTHSLFRTKVIRTNIRKVGIPYYRETWIALSFFSASPPSPPTPRHHHLSPVPAAPVSTVSFNFAVRPSLPSSPLSIVFPSSSSRSPFFFVVLAHTFVLGPMPGLFQLAEPISPSVRAHPPAVGCPAYSPTERPKGKYLVPLLLIKVQSRLLEPSILLPEATSTPNLRPILIPAHGFLFLSQFHCPLHQLGSDLGLIELIGYLTAHRYAWTLLALLCLTSPHLASPCFASL